MTRRWRLFPKYALLIITVVGGMLVASGAISVYSSWRETEANLVALQEEKADSAAARIEQYVVDIAQQISWAALPAANVDHDALEDRKFEYTKLLKQVSAITEVAWIDPNGREQLRISRIAMNTIRGDVDVSREPAFRNASAGGIYYGPVYFRKGTEPYMTIARPAGGGGVTAAEVNLKFVWDVVSRIRIGEKGSAHVIDADGTLIAHPDISLVLRKTDLSGLPQVAALRASDATGGKPARGIAGGAVLSAHAAIPTLRWTVFVESPEAEAFAPLYASILRAGLLLGAGLLIAIAAGFFVARALVRPLQALQEGAARIGAGELDRRIEVKTGDELEGLAEQFNQMGTALKESYAGLERKVEARTAELTEALGRQTATAEVLKVISASPTDVQPVLEAVAERAGLLCKAEGGRVWLMSGDRLRAMAEYGPRLGGEDELPLRRSSVVGRAFLERRLVHVEDVVPLIETEYPDIRELQARLGFRTVLAVPMMRDGATIGVIALLRRWVQPFAEADIGLVRTFADQAVIAIENVRLFNETKDALQQQTATAEVLKVISSSVADTAPVFEKILESCQRLFASSEQGVLLEGEDGLLHLGAHHGRAEERLRQLFPLAVDVAGVALGGERRIAHFKDILNDVDVPPGLRALADGIGVGSYSQVIAPMMWEGEAIGSLYVIRQPATGFTDKEVGLLRTFADQAVIAIQNARLFNETREALERQTATTEVLQAINASPGDIAPVFEAILVKAVQLCDADSGGLWLVNGDMATAAAGHNLPDAFTEQVLQHREVPVRQLLGADGADQPFFQLPDLRESEPYRTRRPFAVAAVELAGMRTYLCVPLRDGDQLVGVFALNRREVREFTGAQIALVQGFATQAQIAMKNARLMKETQESLEQQTASAEVLQVISSSVADTQPVFDKILDSCERLFAASGLGIYLVDEAGILHSGGVRTTSATAAAADGRPPPATDILRAALAEFPRPIAGTATEIAIRTRSVVHFPDVLADAGVPEPLRRVARATSSFSIAFAPMLWEGRGVGVVQVSRQPQAPFSAKELGLLKTFADQAVIAIQNARLFNEIESKSRELELANKHKSEFLANMSHELRTPLNAIIGFSEVLAEKMFGEVNEKQLEYLRDIHGSGHHLLSLINDILDLSKIEAGRMELDLASTSLPMLLDNCTTLVRERASRQGLVLALELDPAVGEWVADVRKLKQVVINLLSNAVKFTPAGGRVTLRARRLEQAVEIAVVDTGVGIAADQQALVFEEFRQAGGDYLRKSEGTGLGLSLARRFVELHGGSIRVESAPGHGSTFAFILPERALEAT